MSFKLLYIYPAFFGLADTCPELSLIRLNYQLMAAVELYSTSLSSIGKTFSGCVDIQIEDDYSAEISMLETPSSSSSHHYYIPKPPPLPRKAYKETLHLKFRNFTFVPHETKNTWDRLFQEQLVADVCILTDDNSYILAHYSVLVSLFTTCILTLTVV